MRSPQMKALMARSDEYRHHNERTKDDLDLALRLFSRGLTYKEIGGVVRRGDGLGPLSAEQVRQLLRRALNWRRCYANSMEDARLELRFAFEVVPAVEHALRKEYDSELNETIREIKYITTNRTPTR